MDRIITESILTLRIALRTVPLLDHDALSIAGTSLRQTTFYVYIVYVNCLDPQLVFPCQTFQARHLSITGLFTQQ